MNERLCPDGETVCLFHVMREVAYSPEGYEPFSVYCSHFLFVLPFAFISVSTRILLIELLTAGRIPCDIFCKCAAWFAKFCACFMMFYHHKLLL